MKRAGRVLLAPTDANEALARRNLFVVAPHWWSAKLLHDGVLEVAFVDLARERSATLASS